MTGKENTITKASRESAIEKIKQQVAEEYVRKNHGIGGFEFMRDSVLDNLIGLIKESTEDMNGPLRGKAPSMSALKRFFRKGQPISHDNIDCLLQFIGYKYSWQSYVEAIGNSTDSIIEDVRQRNDHLELLVTADLDEGDEFDVNYGIDSSVRFKKTDIGDKAFAGESSDYLEIMDSKRSSLEKGSYALIPYFVAGAPVFAVEYLQKGSEERKFYISSGKITDIAL